MKYDKMPSVVQKPTIYESEADLPAAANVVDAYSGAIKELFFIENPHLKKEMPEAKEGLKSYLSNHAVKPIWVSYLWQNTLVKTVPENVYFKLRTARNRNIIRWEEQKSYRGALVAIAGLSVGSAVVSSLVLSGGPKFMRIADYDTLEITNLNRIRATLLDVGQNKAEIAAREVWKLDPFAELDIWNNGISKQTLREFIATDPKIDIFVDAMDSLDLKIMSRLICRELRLPLLMGTDIGEGAIIDVERFDLEPDREILHGFVGEMKIEDLDTLDFNKWIELATKIVGPDYLPDRMRESLLLIGKEISSVPQLGPSAMMTGAGVAFAVRRIASKQDMPSGRYTYGLEEKLIPKYNDPANLAKRKSDIESFKLNFGKKHGH